MTSGSSSDEVSNALLFMPTLPARGAA